MNIEYLILIKYKKISIEKKIINNLIIIRNL